MLLFTALLGRVRFPPPAPPPRTFGNFVELRGGALFLDGKPFHFVGTNIYWLMTRAHSATTSWSSRCWTSA